jgi:hypothetical protein
MMKKYIAVLPTCLLLFAHTVPAIACCEGDPPGNPDCYECEDGAWVLKDWANCSNDYHCEDCEQCVDCECTCLQDCCTDGDCQTCYACGANCECFCASPCCKDWHCLEPCHACVNCECEYQCDPAACETCVGYPPVAAECKVACDDDCETCLDGECINNCTYSPCDYPSYCANACYCTDCSTEEDHDLCNESKETDYQCPGCTVNILYPCSTFYMRDYTGNPKITCTSSKSDCTPQDDPLCYTEYTCKVKFVWICHVCSLDEYGPMGLSCFNTAPDCLTVCTTCKKDPIEVRNRYYTEKTTCPPEEWP